MSKQSKKDIYKIRYQIYRDLGYTSKEASKMRGKSLDVGSIRLDDDRNVIKKNNYKRKVRDTSINTYTEEVKYYKLDTNYSRWGMLTHDKRYRDNTAKRVKYIQKHHKITNNQAHYFLYTMLQSGMSYEEAQEQLLTNKEFEMYEKNKNMKGRK